MALVETVPAAAPSKPPETTKPNGSGPREHTASTITAGKFVDASAAYQIPHNMVRNQTSPVDLWIDTNKSEQELTAELNTYLKGIAQKAIVEVKGRRVSEQNAATTTVTSQPILVAKYVSAELSASEKDFAIEPKGPQQITARTDIPLKWHWLVTPLRASDAGLPLTLTVIVNPGDGGTPLTPIQETVKVVSDATWWEKLIDFAKGLDPVTKLIAAIAAALSFLAGALAWICRRLGSENGICKKLSSKGTDGK